MSDSDSLFGSPDQADARELASSDERSGLDSSSSSSWLTSVDAEIQRDLVASRVFKGQPLTINRFEVERLVGAGSSAAVYAARDPLLDRRVAIKVLGRARAEQVNGARARWIREARALAHLAHRNVVAIYDVGQWNGRPFITMELVEGITLAQWLAAKRRSMAEIVAVFREAGCGLAAAHARGHVHRDFKPANVLVANDGRVVVSDFGLVGDAAPERLPTVGVSDIATATSARESAERGGYPVGTPAYVAPEQRAGAIAHPSADVYSFAVSLVEALLGYRPPFESLTTWQSPLRSRVSRRLFRELRAALKVNPRQRAQSLTALLQALAPRPGARPRRMAGVLTAGGVAVLAAVGLAWSFWGRAWSDAPKAALILSPSVLPAQIDKEVQTLLATAPELRSRAWEERARAVLMLPIPTKIPCRWAAPLRSVQVLGDQVVALESHDRLVTCAIRTGIVTTVADEVICYHSLDDMVLRVLFRDGIVAVYQRGNVDWQTVPLAKWPVSASAAYHRDRDRHCRVSFLRDLPKRRDSELEMRVSGDRKLFRKADRSLWTQVGDAPAKFLVDRVIGYQADDALHHAVVTTSARVRVFDLVTMAMIADAPNPSPDALPGVSRDGSVAVSLGSNNVMWWRQGQLRWQSRPTDTAAGDVMLSPSADRVLRVDGYGTVDVRELGSGRRYALAGGQIQHARFIDDDQIVAVDVSGEVWWWSLARQRSWILADHAGQTWMWGFAMCKRVGSVLTATNRQDRTILISSPNGEWQQELTKPTDAQIYGASCDGDRVLAGTLDGRLLEWNLTTTHKLSERDTGTSAWLWTIATAWPAGGARTDLIGTGSRPEKYIGGRVLMLRDGILSEVFGARFNGGQAGINEIVVSSNGQRAAAVANSGELALIDIVSGTAKTVDLYQGGISRVRFADHDRVVVTGGNDGYLKIWGADKLELQSQINIGHGRIYDLDVHGTLAVVATNAGHVSTWDLSTRRLIHTYRDAGVQAATARFDATGKWIVSGDYEGHVCLHHVDQEGCYMALIGHKAAPAVRHGLFLNDGEIITASDDGTVRQWRPPYGTTSAELACELQRYRFARGLEAHPCKT